MVVSGILHVMGKLRSHAPLAFHYCMSSAIYATDTERYGGYEIHDPGKYQRADCIVITVKLECILNYNNTLQTFTHCISDRRD